MPATLVACSPEQATHQIKLPRTAARAQACTYVKLIRKIKGIFDPCAFDGPIFRAGSSVSIEALGKRPVILEYVGPAEPARRVGSGYGRGREHLYLLWRYNWGREEWIEIGRARAEGPEWVMALRPLAIAALAPEDRRLVDIGAEGDRIAWKVMELLDEQLESAIGPVKARSLGRLYEEVAARIANNAA